jgi:hypothetical protein
MSQDKRPFNSPLDRLSYCSVSRVSPEMGLFCSEASRPGTQMNARIDAFSDFGRKAVTVPVSPNGSFDGDSPKFNVKPLSPQDIKRRGRNRMSVKDRFVDMIR